MFDHFIYAIALLLATTFVHLIFTAVVLGWLHRLASHHWSAGSAVRRSIVLGGVVLAMALAAHVEAGIWAGFYVLVGALSDFRDSFYFSLVTFTTLGYGDVTLDREWRTLAAFQAANGIMMFGWTTALIVAVANRLASLAHRTREH
ncbi:MAG: potassium channel family protein [Myxococcota bacterium]|nr:potassium channel family protein [Myxococcota bacterium]